VLREARLAEELGYDSVWLGDSQLIWREAYVLLGAAAARTSRVKLGTGVTNPVTRHAAVTASAAATLHELSGGRALLGVGVGDSALKSIGLNAVPRATLAAYVQTVRGLVSGDPVAGPNGPMRLTYGGPSVAPPIVVAASGPKMLRLAGEIGDGVIVTRQARADATLAAMLARVREGREASGRDGLPFMTCLSASVAVHHDRDVARQAVRPHVASTLRHVRWGVDAPLRQAERAVNAAYDLSQHMSPAATHAEVVPDEAVSRFAVAGTPDDCIQQIAALFAAGIDELTIRPYGVEGRSRAETLEIFARDVMRPLLA
jgi:5,10-methylenetetrahydromethanopterin reductase